MKTIKRIPDKESFRRDMAKLSFEEKIEIVNKMRRINASIQKSKGKSDSANKPSGH